MEATQNTENGLSDLTVRLGSAVIAGGCLVAWFSDPEQAVEWASENHFGNWVTWRAEPPLIVPLTDEELAGVEKRAAEFSAKLKIK
jgi:hypothetical protein